ncbi:MAG: DegT/DnrJ/EryC1/StrS family aminotransferase [Patescibacteria group bacterium]
MRIPLTKPYFDKSEENAVAKVIRSGWVTQGPKVEEFEEAVRKYVGAKYAVATTSATTALFLCLHALGIGRGDEVIVPSFSFIATANVVVHAGATPVFVDIDPKTYNIDPKEIAKAITKKTKAIIPVDQVGLPADYDKIFKIAKKYRLHVIEDAACALGSVYKRSLKGNFFQDELTRFPYKGKMIGSFGEVACFSFHPRKAITTGEGGMILTNSKKLAEKLRILRHQGMSVSDVVRHKASKVIKENYPVIGYNFRMSDIQAAIGVEQMKKLKVILKKRVQIARYYTKVFSTSKNITAPFIPEGYIHNFQSYIIRLQPNGKITRDVLMQKLLNAGISTRIGVMAAHLETPYRKMYPRLALAETEAATKQTLTIPLYFNMTAKQQDFIISKILEYAEG